MTTKHSVITPGVEDKVVPVASIGILPTNLGRWKRSRVAPPWLVESIKDLGLLQAPVVRPAGFPLDPPNKDYVLVIGEKRMLAIREIGAELVRVSVRTFPSPEKAHAAAIAENIERVDLSLHDEMQVVVRYAKTARRNAHEVAKDLRMQQRKVETYLKAHAQMSPALLKEFATITSRAHGFLFLSAAVRTKNHERQHAIVYGKLKPLPRKRNVRAIVKAVEMVRSAEVLKLRLKGKEAAMAHMEAHRPLNARERDLVALVLQWMIPTQGTANYFPLQSSQGNALRRHETDELDETNALPDPALNPALFAKKE